MRGSIKHLEMVVPRPSQLPGITQIWPNIFFGQPKRCELVEGMTRQLVLNYKWLRLVLHLELCEDYDVS